MHKKYLYIFLLFLVSSLGAQNNAFIKQSASFAQKDNSSIVDSIKFYLKNSNKNISDIRLRLKNAKRAKKLSEQHDLESLKLKSYLELSTIYFDNNKNSKLIIDYNSALLIRDNHKALNLAVKLNDSLSLANANKNLGYYYFDKFIDSAYYYDIKAVKLYRTLHDNFNAAVVLLDIAFLQQDEKDYIGSEINSITAISLLDQLDESDEVIRYKSYFYNNLGILFKELSQFDESVKYNLKAIDLKKQLKGNNTILIDGQINNLANVYKRSKDYDLAIKYYNKILENKNLMAESPGYYAVVLDNYAHTLFLSKNYKQLPSLFLKALKICDSIGDSYKTIVINQHLAKYYNFKKQKDSAKYYAYRAKDIAYPNYTNELLESYSVLSEVEDDSIAIKYYNEYIKLNDSLIKNERATRNKFARIQYETDQYIEETKRLGTQNILISIIAAIFVISLGLLYFIRLQKGKNQRLLFEKEQQEANQEIYGLMLRQQTKLEEGRMQERHRIAEDLHDGILSQLLGTRMNLGFLDLKGDDDAMEDYHRFLDEIQKIEKEIRSLSHELKGDEALTKTNFESIMHQYLKTQSHVGNFKYEIINKGILFDLINDFTKVNIYRILQEAIQNIIKHAKANHVWIHFYLQPKQLNLIIEDDGVGFDVNSDKKGIGLKNIASRIQKLNGSLKIESIPHKKTLIHIIVPV